MLEGAVFDLDGTLVDSAPSIALTLEHMRRSRGMANSLALENVRRWVSLGAPELVRLALEEAAGDREADVAEFRSVYAGIPTPPHSVYTGIHEALQSLESAGLRLGVCSNKPQRLCEQVLRDVGIASFFRAVVGGDVVRRCKPHGEHLLATLQATNIDRGAAVYVGDSRIDFQTAQAAGLPFVLAAYGYVDGGLEETPAMICVRSPNELSVVLGDWREPTSHAAHEARHR